MKKLRKYRLLNMHKCTHTHSLSFYIYKYIVTATFLYKMAISQTCKKASVGTNLTSQF